MKKQKWDKPISKKAFKAICRKLEGYEKKYGFDEMRWAVNKFISQRNEMVKREKHIKEMQKELEKLQSAKKLDLI